MNLSDTEPSSSASDSAADAPPPPPRPVTPRVRARSWNERSVRLWIILTFIVAITTIYFAIRDIGIARLERRLILDGERLYAKIDEIDGLGTDLRTGRQFTRAESHHLKLSYEVKGKPYTTELDLPGKGSGVIAVGQTIEMRIDPDNPKIATLQTTPRPWAASLAVVILLAPLTLIAIVITLLQRRAVLRAWQTGEPATSVVVDSHRSGIAPRSHVMRFTVDDDEDNVVHSTLYPRSAEALMPGDEFWIVRDRSGRILVADLYT